MLTLIARKASRPRGPDAASARADLAGDGAEFCSDARTIMTPEHHANTSDWYLNKQQHFAESTRSARSAVLVNSEHAHLDNRHPALKHGHSNPSFGLAELL